MNSIIKSKFVDRLERWFIPISLRRLVQTQGAIDTIFSFSLAVLFFSELVKPGTFTPRDVLLQMPSLEIRRYLVSYLWYALLHLAHLTVSLLVYMDVRDVKCNVDGRRRTILLFLVFSPLLLINLLLAAAKVLYFPWASLGIFYVLHTMFVAGFWLYALRYYKWLGDGELVHFESPLVAHAAGPAVDTEPPAIHLELQDHNVGGAAPSPERTDSC